MPLDSVIMDSITCKEKRKYHLKFQGSGPAQMKEHVLINVLFVINHIPCSNQIDGLLRMFLNLMSDSP